MDNETLTCYDPQKEKKWSNEAGLMLKFVINKYIEF